MLKPAPDWLRQRPIAHRGYHDLAAGRAENSWSAFQAAIDHGYAIECDLQITATGEPVVFHDPVLGRMTGVEENVRDRTPQDLAKLSLLDTQDTIHTLKDHLKQVDGSVPLILELKGVKGEDAGFVEGVAEALRGYAGDVALMSFDHWVCAQFAEHLPDLPRGLTAEGDDAPCNIHTKAMQDYDLQFVSYGVRDLPNAFVGAMHEAGLPIITWTVRTPEQVETSYRYADQITFEGFAPPAHMNRLNRG